MKFFDEYFDLISSQIKNIHSQQLLDAVEMIKRVKSLKGKVILVGNGGSAAMASHISIDLTKNAGIRSVNFNEADLITCFANDFGYDRWAEMAIEFYAAKEDVLIAISSSGKSENIINAAKKAKEMGISVISFSGFDKDNPLSQLGDLNFWVDCRGYNIVEMTHHVWLVAIVDHLIGSIEYQA